MPIHTCKKQKVTMKSDSIRLTFSPWIFRSSRFTADGVLEWNYTFHGRAEKNGHITRVPLSSCHYVVFHNVICNWCNRVVQSRGIIIFACPLQPRHTVPRHGCGCITFTNSMNIWTKGFANSVRDWHFSWSTDFPGATSLCQSREAMQVKNSRSN